MSAAAAVAVLQVVVVVVVVQSSLPTMQKVEAGDFVIMRI